MTKVYAYHTTNNGQVHKGRTVDCFSCSRGKPKKKRKKKSGVPLASSTEPAAKVSTARKCQCGKKIKRNNVTGMCLACLSAERKKKCGRKATQRLCKVKECKSVLGRTNKTGFCATCYRNSDLWRQKRENFNSWVTSVVCEKSVAASHQAVLEKVKSKEVVVVK